ncbi:MAG TPA: TRAP transporter large permease subunit [Methylomirabilota bacterium]|nr:TRAP transporter large permease subunit [Methylomirabilota bacterium]
MNAPAGGDADAVARWFHRLENGALICVLAAMAVVPLAEVALRRFNASIVGAAALVQHFTLIAGMLGGAIAARENRLLSLSNLTSILGGRGRWLAVCLSHGVAAGLSAVLCVASYHYVVETTPADRVLAYGISYRVFKMCMPVGFGLIAVRLVWHGAAGWRGRAAALALAAGVFWLGAQPPIDPAHLRWIALGMLGVVTVLGAPIFVTLGGAALILFWSEGRPATLVPLEHYDLTVNPVLPSLPLFTLAGYILAEGGASKRLVRLFEIWLGRLRGGPAIVTALVCAFFTSFTGASGVTILALGGLLLPVLLAARYSEKDALGLLTGAGALGLLFPPCLPLILYAIIAQQTIANLELPAGAVVADVSINQMFLGGVGPGMLLLAMTAWWGVRRGPRVETRGGPFDWKAGWAAVWAAKWELMLPVVALVTLFSGLATPVEAAAVSALYAFVSEVLVHRDLSLRRDVPRVMVECGLLIGGVLLILGVAMGLTKYLIFADVPTLALEGIQKWVHSKWMFLLLLNVLLLVVGCLMDIYSAIIVVVPLIVPMGVAFGVDSVHLGIVFMANLQLGYLTPPVGMNLFLASYRFGKPMGYITRAVLPILAIQAVAVLLVTYVPPLTTWLPRLLK